MWLWLTMAAQGQAPGAWDASLHTALWTQPPEVHNDPDGNWVGRIPQSRSGGGQLGWRPKVLGSSPELFLRATLWRYSDVSNDPFSPVLLRLTSTTALVGLGWRHVQPLPGRWSVDLAANVAVGSSTASYWSQLMVSPCVEAGVWGENVRVGLRGCGARRSRGFAGHDIVATSPEPAGIRLVVGTKLHTWREH